jgi:hypothetical protein
MRTRFKVWMARTFLRAEVEAMQDRIAAANGALSDIVVIVTSCVPVKGDAETKKIAESVLHRILSSSCGPSSPPSWFRHAWEERLWGEHERGEIRACAHPDESARDRAKALRLRSAPLMPRRHDPPAAPEGETETKR